MQGLQATAIRLEAIAIIVEAHGLLGPDWKQRNTPFAAEADTFSASL